MQSSAKCLQTNHFSIWLLAFRFKSTQSHYAVLGVKQNATKKEIRDAFLDLSKKHHPDQTKTVGGSHEKFVKINEAYSVLSKEESRHQYDLTLNTGHPYPHAGPPGSPSYKGPYNPPPGGAYYDPYGHSRYGYYYQGHDPYGRQNQNPFENIYANRGRGPYDNATREEFYQRQREAYKREREYHQKQSEINRSVTMRMNRILTQFIIYFTLSYVCFLYTYQFYVQPAVKRNAYQKKTGKNDAEVDNLMKRGSKSGIPEHLAKIETDQPSR